MTKEEEIKIKLLELYPDKKVSQLGNHNKLYLAINNERKLKNMTTSEYLSSLGFSYSNKKNYSDNTNLIKQIKEDLLKFYPQKEVSRLVDYPKLYAAISSERKSRNMTTSEFLESLGFSYNNKKKELSESEIISMLNDLFPNKEIDKISTISKANMRLYTSIIKNAQALNSNTVSYLEYLGFEKINDHITYDMYNINKLKTSYAINETDLANLMDCSKNNINLKTLRFETSRNKNKWLIKFTNTEIDRICNEIINNKQTYLFTDNFSFIIADDINNPVLPKALIMRNDIEVKVCYKLPDKLDKLLRDNLLDIFCFEELSIFKKLEDTWISEGRPIENNLKSVEIDNDVKIRLRGYASQKNLSLLDYLQLKDFIYSNRKKPMSDEEIIERINKYVVEGNTVVLKSDSPDYPFFANRASRLGLSIDDYFAKFGFYHESYVKTPEEVDDMHKEIIKNKYLVKDNIIYLESYDPYYITISALTRYRKISLNDYINQLGFERIIDPRKLPKDYIPYDYSSDLENVGYLDDKKLHKGLYLLSNSRKQVYLNVNTYLYNLLCSKAKMLKTTVTTVVENYGFFRVSDSSLINNLSEKEKEVSEFLQDIEEDSISYYLKKLDDIETSYEKKHEESSLLSRNRSLVHYLKELYGGHCQLCSETSPIPPIYKEDGTIYSEVHHIVGFHNADSKEELEVIDSYKNAIVLCPYHHKYLHYNAGGGYVLKHGTDNALYLENENGDKIEITLNYHLK